MRRSLRYRALWIARRQERLQGADLGCAQPQQIVHRASAVLARLGGDAPRVLGRSIFIDLCTAPVTDVSINSTGHHGSLISTTEGDLVHRLAIGEIMLAAPWASHALPIAEARKKGHFFISSARRGMRARHDRRLAPASVKRSRRRPILWVSPCPGQLAAPLMRPRPSGAGPARWPENRMDEAGTGQGEARSMPTGASGRPRPGPRRVIGKRRSGGRFFARRPNLRALASGCDKSRTNSSASAHQKQHAQNSAPVMDYDRKELSERKIWNLLLNVESF
jgi:hypothetical protein